MNKKGKNSISSQITWDYEQTLLKATFRRKQKRNFVNQ